MQRSPERALDSGTPDASAPDAPVDAPYEITSDEAAFIEDVRTLAEVLVSRKASLAIDSALGPHPRAVIDLDVRREPDGTIREVSFASRHPVRPRSLFIAFGAYGYYDDGITDSDDDEEVIAFPRLASRGGKRTVLVVRIARGSRHIKYGDIRELTLMTETDE